MRKLPLVSTLLLMIIVIILVIVGAAYWNGIKERVPNDTKILMLCEGRVIFGGTK